MVTTFHAFCARLLRTYHCLIKRSGRFSIYDEEDASKVMKEAAKGLGLEGSWEGLRADIDRLKNRAILPEGDLAPHLDRVDPEGRYLKIVRPAYQCYEEKLARYDAVDFNDLLLKAVLLLEAHPEILDPLRRRYILVDEYQDTSPLQERLLRRLAAPAFNLCAVGDDDQAIYAFRHADLNGILTFESRYPGAKVIRMEENYRSSGKICEAARRVIGANRRRHPKVIRTANPPGPPVEVAGFPWEGEEASWIGGKIRELNAEGTDFGEIAILCRVASLFRPIEKALSGALIPYLLVDGLAFWERREIKDIIAYLRFLHNPNDYLSLKRIINIPPRGLGKRTVQRIEDRLKRSHSPLTEILEMAGSDSPRLRRFLDLIESLRDETHPVGGLIEVLLNRTGYEAYLVKNCPDADRRIGNLIQLAATARRFEREQAGERSCHTRDDLSEFLLQTGLSTGGPETEGRPDQVRLMTIHAAKGLEFKNVFLVGLEEGILPHARCRGNIEEERRLFYVAVTRAKERLFLTWSARRTLLGREINNPISPFLREIFRRNGWLKSPFSRKEGEAVVRLRPYRKERVFTS